MSSSEYNRRGLDVSNVFLVQKLTRQCWKLRDSFQQSEASALMQDIDALEAEDKALQCIVSNLHKEVEQVIRTAKRLQQAAAREHQEALDKIQRAKMCIQTIIDEEGDFLSDSDAFVDSYFARLDDIGEKLHDESFGEDLSFMNVDIEDNDDDSELTPLALLNNATRRKLLIQVEIERVNEEIREELEFSATAVPASHPLEDLDDDDVLDSEVEMLTIESKQQSLPAEVYATNIHTNACIQNAVNNLTAQCAQ
eukprot:g5623.t1